MSTLEYYEDWYNHDLEIDKLLCGEKLWQLLNFMG